MNKWLLQVFLIVGLSALVFGCGSDKSSTEACLHDVTLNLDKGNYDAVLASPCADAMAKGAAWFGKAGFDIKDVINSLISANTTSTQSDLSLYMTALVPNTLSNATLSDLDKAKSEYDNVPSGAGDKYKDAQFYISLVDTVKSLSLIKIVIPNLLGPDGGLNTACDNNANGVPDDAGATACALIASTNINSIPTGTIACTGATYTPSAPASMNLYYDSGTHLQQVVSAITSTINIDTFSGLLVTMDTVTGGDTSGCNPPGTTQYQRLLYYNPITTTWLGATTSTEVCYDALDNPWPCPIIGANLDLVGSINASIGSSVDALISSGTGSSSDVGQSITDIQNQACTSSCLAVCPGTSCPSTCTSPYDMTYCSSQDIANYIENNLQ